MSMDSQHLQELEQKIQTWNAFNDHFNMMSSIKQTGSDAMTLQNIQFSFHKSKKESETEEILDADSEIEILSSNCIEDSILSHKRTSMIGKVYGETKNKIV